MSGWPRPSGGLACLKRMGVVFPPHASLGLGSPPCLYSSASEPGQEKFGRHGTLGVARNFSVQQGQALHF